MTDDDLKQNQELRAAIHAVFPDADIDTFIDGGWGEVFQLFHAAHDRYPITHEEITQAAAEYRRVASSGNFFPIDLGRMSPFLPQ